MIPLLLPIVSGVVTDAVTSGGDGPQPGPGGLLDGFINGMIAGATGPDPDNFWKSLGDRSSLLNQAYAKWCAKYQPAKLTGESSIWDSPGSRPEFDRAWREAQIAVRAAYPGLTGDQEWQRIAAGTFNAAMRWSAVGDTGGSGDVGQGTTMQFPFLWMWPWEPGALRAATWKHWLAWSAMAMAIMGVLWMVLRKRRRYRKNRRKL